MGLALCSDCRRKRIIHDLSSDDLYDDDSVITISYSPKAEQKTQPYPEKSLILDIELVNSRAATNSSNNVPQTAMFAKQELLSVDSAEPRYTREPSLRQRLKDRRRMNNSPRTPVGWYDEELESKFYIKALEDNTLKHLHETMHTVESMVEKGAAFSEELAHQGNVIVNTSHDLLKTQQDLNQSKHSLNAMSIHGKFANVVSQIKSKRQGFYSSEDEADRDYLTRSMSLPAKFSYRSFGDTKQQQIKGRVKQLIRAMDTLSGQQLGIAEELEYQVPHLQKINKNSGRVSKKIKRQMTKINDLKN
jgi:hypothetical protein